MITVVLVGGIADGRRVQVQEGTRSVAVAWMPRMQPTARFGVVEQEHCLVPHETYNIDYVVEGVAVATPMGSTYQAGMKNLINGYRAEVQR